jgi:hypothetical protein
MTSILTQGARTRPPKPLLLKTPVEEPKSIIVPVENLDLVAQSIAENEQMARERIRF